MSLNRRLLENFAECYSGDRLRQQTAIDEIEKQKQACNPDAAGSRFAWKIVLVLCALTVFTANA
jgi:hypothetical protein